MLKSCFIIFLLCLLCKYGTSDTFVESIDKIFGAEDCVEGFLEDIPINHEEQVPESEETAEHYKSALSQIQELAKFNDIEYHYELVSESGPAHEKLFNISLNLGGDIYFGDGTSLKNARREAARVALKNTELERPVYLDKPKSSLKHLPEEETPTVKLNNVCTQLGFKCTYYLDDFPNKNVGIGLKNKNYLQEFNNTINLENYAYENDKAMKGPFYVKVEVEQHFGSFFADHSHQIFSGKGRTIQEAKHEAAKNAIKAISSLKEESFCLKDGYEEECKQVKNVHKSPISLVYEEAQKQGLNVEFVETSAKGPDHKKTFTVKCTLGDFETEGEGNSKKTAKKNAAEKMIENLSLLPQKKNNSNKKSSPVKTGKKNKSKSKKVVKSSMDKINLYVDQAYRSAKNFFGSENDDNINKDKKSRSNNAKNKIFSPKKELLTIANLLEFEITHTNHLKDSTFYSFTSLGLEPNILCFSKDFNKHISEKRSASNALKFLYKSGLLDALKKQNTYDFHGLSLEKYIYVLQDLPDTKTE